MDGWKRFKEWEASVPNRFDPEKSEPESNYNLHHSVVEATPEEVSSLLKTGGAALDPGPGLKKGFYLLFIDGGKKANPTGENMGEGAIGAVLKEPDLKTIEGAQVSKRIGQVPDPHTAEYEALIQGLHLVREQKLRYVAVFSDSRTLVNQVNGAWKHHTDHLKKSCEAAVDSLKSFAGTQVSWVPRELNKEADELVERAFASEAPGNIIHAIE